MGPYVFLKSTLNKLLYKFHSSNCLSFLNISCWLLFSFAPTFPTRIFCYTESRQNNWAPSVQLVIEYTTKIQLSKQFIYQLRKIISLYLSWINYLSIYPSKNDLSVSLSINKTKLYLLNMV